MTKVIYSVATSLDGFIARPDGSFDWIPMDPSMDWTAFVSRFDTLVMGRRTYDATLRQDTGIMEGLNVYVFSQSLVHDAVKDATLVTGDPAVGVRQLREEAERDIWLFGGGELFRTLLDAGEVDVVEVGIIPILLREGIPFSPPGDGEVRLVLRDTKQYPTGIMLLTYDVGSRNSTRGVK